MSTQSEPAVPKTRRRRWLKRLGILFAVFAVYVAFIAARLFLFQPDLEIGPETTFVDGPLRPDGTIDYVAALNDEWSKGVTPENNAAVPLMEAFGPGVIDPVIREEFFRRLGIEMLPEEGNYFVSQSRFFEERNIEPERAEALRDEWADAETENLASEFPELAHWVEENQSPRQKIIEATRRKHFYAPYLPAAPKTVLISADMSFIVNLREAARLLWADARLQLSRGDLNAACDDAIACHRLARLQGQHTTLMGYLVSVAIDGLASDVSESILLNDRLTLELAKRFRLEIEALPPVPDAADTLDHGERLVSLDASLAIVKRTGGASTPDLPFGIASGFDPNILLRRVNGFYDEFIEVMRIEEYEERTKRLDELNRTFNKQLRTPHVDRIAKTIFLGSKRAFTEEFSSRIVSLIAPAFEALQHGEDRLIINSRLLQVGSALAEYRAVEGEFPEALSSLVPKYLDEVPVDLFVDASLRYRRVEGGFLLYSVGQNGRDDGGFEYGEHIFDAYDSGDLRLGVAPLVPDPAAR